MFAKRWNATSETDRITSKRQSSAYAAHLGQSEAFAREHPNYTLKRTGAHTFRNLQILIHEGQWVLVSKGKTPAIHFVIRHPKLRSAIESFIPPVTEPSQGS